VVYRRLRLVLALALGFAVSAAAQDARGPLGGRENWLLAQPRLDLPAGLPETLGAGRSELHLSIDWGSDFGWQQDAPGERPRERFYLVDGEQRTLDLEWRRGLGDRFDIEARVPVLWRGAGSLDGLINWYHRWSHLPDSGRPLFDSGRFRVEAKDALGRGVGWNDTGTGLGNLELGSRLALATSPSGWRAAVAARVALPTGSGPFAGHGSGLGLQLLAGRRAGRFDLAGGLGGTAQADNEVAGFRYARARVHAFAAAEWLVFRRVHLLAETSAASRLITNVPHYSGVQWYLRLGGRLQFDSGWALEAGLTEGLLNQRTTTDVAFLLGASRRIP
jgi:Protein of unknown function (DUF3187)